MQHFWKVFLLVIVGMAVILWWSKTPIVSRYLSKTLGVKVSLGEMRVNSEMLKISDFQIDNPAYYESPNAFVADSIHCYYRWKSLLSNPRIIDRIELDHARIVVEFSNLLGAKNNWLEIARQIPKSTPDDREVIIRKLIITDLTVEVLGKGPLFKGPRTIDRIELNDISSKKGFPTQEIIRQIFGKVDLLDLIKMLPEKDPTGILKKLMP